MMLEGLVAWVLNNYLGKYVENLNTDQLSVALLSGKVELENLPLKKDALRHLGLPVEVKAGFIGKVQLQVPVRQIRSAPWLIAIEKLYLVAAPVNLDEWDIEVEAHIAHERKVALLDALEAQWRAEHEANDAGYYATSYSSWLNYGTGLLANIVENLQLKLKDVHIRYEDVVTCAPGAFAFGLIVESLAAESCDSEWKSGFTLLADPNGCSYKLMELHNLAIYWDNMQAPGGMYAHCNITELTERMSETWKSSHRYIVSPASASARVRRERTEQPLRSRTRPRLNAHLTLDTVLLNLTSRQYSEAVGCALGLERIGRLREFRALRPAVPVRGHARLWWIYALSCHTPYHHWTESMPTWESCVESARRLRQYVEICLVMLSNPAATLPPDKKAAKDDYEWRMPLHVLKPLREIAMRKVPKSTPASTPEKPSSSGRSMLVHWFPQWWGWYGAVPPEAPLDRPPEPDPPPAPPDLEEEILDVIADSIDNNTLLKRDTVFAKFEFILNKGSLNLCMDNGDTDRVGGGESDASGCGAALELQFGAVRVGVESRPRAASHALHLSLGTLCLRERITPDTLFPVLCAPQGVIREGLSAMSATASAMSWCRAHAHAPPQPYLSQEPLFQLSYEKKPFGLNCDYKLWVKSAALEMVYCADVARWVRQFLVAPWEARAAGRAPLSTRHVRTTTAATLITHWEHIVHAHPGDRRSWQVELDISAPQIFFVEQLSSRDAAVLVVDFGRLRLANAREVREEQAPGTPNDDDEMFMTPCSTPPGSLLSPASPPHPTPKQAQPTLDAANLHNKLYERYKIQLSDLQILVGRVRDNWKYAHTKSTSSLHLLDRFSISLQAERRVVHTSDPQYPNAALCGSLPALVAHLSEHKLNALTAVVTNSPLFNHLSKETPNPEQSSDVEEEESESSETERSEQSSHHNSTLFMLQFAIEQLSLEVQSLGRSIAEVQVCGVRAALGVRPRDTSLSLSVHSLLLVDALQTYGPDFELLVASHKHVGMDTASGSILGSEPTSPTSPTSPTWPSSPDTRAAPHPHALHQALYSLHNLGNTTKGIPEPERDRISPAPGWPQAPWNGFNFGNGGQWGHAPWGAAGLVDSEALIAVELCLVKGEGDSEDLRIANILFNNLDIIANQETIVELIGFTQRVMGGSSGKKATPTPEVPVTPATVAHAACSFNEEDDVKKDVRTEITFDFHRLGVLLLRAAIHDGNVVARKIATATISEAKIQATLDGSRIEVGGSLGGVQVVSLCEGGGIHSRVVHAGRAASMNAPLHALPADEDKALLFTIHRKVGTSEDGETPVVEARVCVQVASVWYTHSGPLLRELRSCLSEFKRYLADLARSIRAAAHDMAIGLVHPRSESLYSNPKLCTSSEGVSPRRRTTSLGNSLDDPTDLSSDNVLLSVSIELESPVVVVPRHAQSTQVFVAHLGRMSLANRPGPPQHTLYNIRVRDISLATLDVGEKLKLHPLSAENMCEIYDVADGRPVLHNTALQLAINYCDGEAEGDVNYQCEVSGKIVGGLHVTAHREQYEQLLDTLNWISTSSSAPPAGQDVTDSATSQTQVESSGVPVEVAVPTLRLDPAVRAAVLAVKPPAPEPARQHPTPPPTPPLLVNFELPMFSVELRADLGDGERSLVELAFREFTVNYKRTHEYETSLQVSLHSITMEDLTKERDSKHRLLMVSHTPQVPPKAVFVSKSCPDFVTEYPFDDISSVGSIHHMKGCSPSLPSQLNVIAKQNKERRSKRDSKCGVTPPCSPECGIPVDSTNQEESLSGDDNLVWLSVHTRDPRHPHFEDKFNKVSKLTKVEFNSLNLVVSIDSWVAVLDFFGVAGDDLPEEQKPEQQQEAVDSPTQESGITQTEMSIRSLSVVVVAGRGESCRALVSRVLLVARADAHAHTRHVQGRLGALLLTDLTPHSPLWRDRFRTHGDQALTFEYRRLSSNEALSAGHESSLSIEMGPVSYVHTKRFVLELQAFATEFSLLRRVIMQARLKVSVGVGGDGAGSRGSRTRVRVSCASPVIVVPVSGRARAALAAHLDSLSLDNCFKTAGESGTVSTLTDPEAGVRETLDVRSVRLEGLALWMARGGEGLRVRRQGPPLLHAPAHLTLQIEHNMSSTHNVPDMTIQGTLTTLQCALDPAQYRLVRGVLAHNLAEPVDDLMPPVPPTHVPTTEQVWTTTSLKFDLHDVSVRLEPEHGVSSLACINFIKSRLLVETYSDLSQDIDLVSQEILVSDTRYSSEPANRRGNVFTNIVQPMREHRHSVQAEVHARKRRDSSAYTILVNNMRLMAVLDWWEAANQFIMQPPPSPADSDQQHLEEILTSTRSAASAHTHSGINTNSAPDEEPSMELKLNITDSQLVLVEDPSVWDTNAVILRSTTVITYRCADAQKPVSCELNELEVFSCVLGLEEETALSIVDPAALHVSIDAQRVLHVAMGTLNLRLSYHDMRMFASMLQSLPVQARAALSGKSLVSGAVEDAPANRVYMRSHTSPIAVMSNPQPSTSAGVVGHPGGWMYPPKWMKSQSRVEPVPPPAQTTSIWPLKAVQVSAECITLCVIDDCLDSDVPLLEVSLADLQLEQDLRKIEEGLEDPVLVCTPAGGAPSSVGSCSKKTGAGGGRLAAMLTVDYYNRILSGWEPIVEPWRFESGWEYSLTSELSLGRVQVEVASAEVLNSNVTSTLIELCQLVKANWAADYYAPQQPVGAAEQSPKGSPAGHRRRSPFVPYALRNHTGHKLWFTALLTTADVLREQTSWSSPDDSWMVVRAGETEPFSFGGRRGRSRGQSGGGVRGAGQHPARLHQLALRMEGWAPPDPVCVDRVGVFFRQLTHAKTGEEARLVFEVSLEGSARKLVTVRSALQVLNKLPHAVEVRVDQAPTTVNFAVASLACAGRARRCALTRALACAQVRLSGLSVPVAIDCEPPVHFLHPLHPLFVNCVQWSGGAVRSAVVDAGECWSAPVSGHASAVRVRPLMRASQLPAPQHTPALVDWRTAPAPCALQHYECRAPPEHVYRFWCVIVRERFPPDRGAVIAGHTLTLMPALRVENLLPLELHFRASPTDGAVCASGTIPPGETWPLHEVNVEEGVEVSVKLEGFAWSTALSVGGGAGAGSAASFSARLKLRDSSTRRLYLNARVTFKKTDGVKVSISAAYWLVNRTGLPLVFRAEGAATDAAGQFDEHEVARMVAPLLFSFAEADGGPTISARVGHGLPGHPEWCSPFGLGVGVAVKKLQVRGGGDVGDAGGERVYAVGVRVRTGRGRYRHTNIVTFTPRYQLHNNTSHHLQFAQKCTATTLNDPGAIATHVSAVSGCYLPWHWARWEREHLLCVRLLAPQKTAGRSTALTAWSGGFRVDTARTLHVACREAAGSYRLVRVEVVCQGATMFVVLTDGESAPPPLRIDNYSPVSIMFHQVGCSEECAVGAHGRAVWALPEPEQQPALALRAPGGPRTTIALDQLPAAHHLLYQNFIYVAFTHTQTRDINITNAGKQESPSNHDNVLVLEVPLGSTRVMLGRKRYGDRSQLWRRGPNDQLIHEGSSPPQPTDILLPDDAPLSPHCLVLDIEDPAPRPGRASALVLRRADGRRASTQAWRLVGGRMCCAHANLCVQPQGMSLMALTPGTRVVLGLPAPGRTGRCLDGAVPGEQAVSWHTLRPGSGRLQVTLNADGPTRLIRIHDVKSPESGWIEGGDEEEESPSAEKRCSREWGLRVGLAGLSVSLVARDPPAELVHALFSEVQLELAVAAPPRGTALAFALAVQHMQWDNQLLGTPSPVLLYCLPGRGGSINAGQPLPALHAAVELQLSPTKRYNAYLFKHLVVALRPLAIRLEERLILKVWAWAWTDDEEGAREQADEADYETRRMLDELTALHATRYYFALIKIIPSQIRLSMCTANKLEASLGVLKRRLGLTMIKFEDAAVELEPFVRAHVFDTASYLARQMLAHFKDELKWQAAKILGSVDFLGNPLGFVADVSEGVTGLLLEGNVGALLQNVTHGLSNSAAKVTASLGDGLERVVGDEAHEETRRRIRSAAPGHHIAAGFRGLGLGILGGMTSLVKHSYEGATQEGLGGFLAGVGKGLVGTVTKPVIGVLDLAAETASALRDTSRRSDKWVPGRTRGPRCCSGPGGLLPRYCAAQAQGAALLYALNSNDYSERFLAYRIIRDTPHDIRALLSDTYLRIFTCKHTTPQVVMETHLSNLISCLVVQSEGAHYVELGVRGGTSEAVRRPRVQCDTEEIASWVSRHAAYARQLYHEHTHTLLPHADL